MLKINQGKFQWTSDDQKLVAVMKYKEKRHANDSSQQVPRPGRHDAQYRSGSTVRGMDYFR
jgi:hypothetical protein